MPPVNGAFEVAALSRLPWSLGFGSGAAASPTCSSPFASAGWLRAWHEARTAQGGEEVLAFFLPAGAEAEAGCVPFAPEALARGVPGRGLRLGPDDLGAPDHLDLLLPDDAAARELAALLLEQSFELSWDRLRLLHLAPGAPRALALAGELALQGCQVRSFLSHPCFFIDLPESIDAYMALLGARFREGVRRKRRKLHKGHAVALQRTSPQETAAVLQTMFAWNRERFGAASAFHDPTLEPMLQGFCGWLEQAGGLRLWELRCDGELAAAWLGFAWGDCLHFYQAGWDASWSLLGVGAVLTQEMIRQAIEEGFARFDFLRGDEDYKRHWATGLAWTWNCVIYRNSLAGGVGDMLETGWAACRPLARRLKRRLLR